MSEESAVKLKPFSGKKEEWVYWAPMFLARADAKGYQGIIDDVPNNNDVLDPRANAYRIKLKQLNKTGYSELVRKRKIQVYVPSICLYSYTLTIYVVSSYR